MGVELAGDPRAVCDHRGPSTRGLAARRAPSAPVLEPAMLRVRSFGLAVTGSICLLCGFGGDAARRGSLPHHRVARERLDRRPHALSGSRNGDRVQRPLRAPRRACRLPHPGRHRRAALWLRVDLVDHPYRQRARVLFRVPSGHGDRRSWSRPRDPDAHRRRRVLACARALCHRGRRAHDGTPDRRGARDAVPSRCSATSRPARRTSIRRG